MRNSKCLKILEESLAYQNQNQLSILDKKIRTIERGEVAQGLSGPAINEVKGLCIKALESRVDSIFEILRDLPLKYSRDLDTKISTISLKYFPADLGELHARLDGIIRIARGEHARDIVLNKVAGANKNQIHRFRTQLDHFLLILKTSRLVSTLDKIVFSLEAICLLFTAFLAGKWSSDPTHLYQPYIIVVGVIISLLEIGRRIAKKSEN